MCNVEDPLLILLLTFHFFFFFFGLTISFGFLSTFSSRPMKLSIRPKKKKKKKKKKRQFCIGLIWWTLKLGQTLDSFFHRKKKKKKKKKNDNKIVWLRAVLFKNWEFSLNRSEELYHNDVLCNLHWLLLVGT